MNTENNNYTFIDSQNLNLSIRSQDWVLDFKRFRIYLRDKYKISKAFLFIGYVSTNENLYISLQEAGYILVFKPTLFLPGGGVKGNVWETRWPYGRGSFENLKSIEGAFKADIQCCM